MDLSKAMKRRHRLQCPFIESLPEDLVVEIVATVATSSLPDLHRLKLVCKQFKEVADDNSVLRRASIEELHAMRWRIPSQTSSILMQLAASGNPDAIYQQGMIEYFSKAQIQSGLHHLKRAADYGHREASYVLGIILFSGESSRHEGISLLNKLERMKKNGGMDICHGNVKKLIHEMWINNRIIRHESLCLNPKRRNGEMRGLPKLGEWSWDFMEDSFCSDACKWDYELNEFCILLGV